MNERTLIRRWPALAVFCLSLVVVTIDQQTGAVVAGPDITTRGFVPEHDASDALGALPAGISTRTYPPEGQPPGAILDAEFLVAMVRSKRPYLRAVVPAA